MYWEKWEKLGWGIRMAFEIHFHFDSIKYYHIRQQKPNPTNLAEEIDKKTLFWHFAAFKIHFSDFWMELHDLLRLLNIENHLVLSWYEISSRSKRPKSRNILFWHFGSFKNTFYRLLNDPSWPSSVGKCWNTFSTIIICNIKSIQKT